MFFCVGCDCLSCEVGEFGCVVVDVLLFGW